MLQERPDGNAGGGHLRVNRNTVNRYYGLLRKAILSESIREAQREIGEYKLDESYFGAREARSRGGGQDASVRAAQTRREGVRTVVPDCSRESLMPIIKGLILEQSTIYTDGWRAYDGLVHNGYEHYRVFHSENEFVRGKSHVNGIENVQTCGLRGASPRGGLRSSTVAAPPRSCYT